MEDLNLVLNIIKSVTPLLLGVMAWYAKGLLTSLKAVEHDINQIKTTIAEQAAHHSGLVERIDKNEERHDKMEAEVNSIGKKVAVLESR